MNVQNLPLLSRNSDVTLVRCFLDAFWSKTMNAYLAE